VKVHDWIKSERGPQRRRGAGNRLLHCCCICGTVSLWGKGWSVYCSIRELDDGVPVPKFCSRKCAAKGGPNASNVTAEMRQAAYDAEWREPRAVYRDATDIEKYRAAAAKQRRP